MTHPGLTLLAIALTLSGCSDRQSNELDVLTPEPGPTATAPVSLPLLLPASRIDLTASHPVRGATVQAQVDDFVASGPVGLAVEALEVTRIQADDRPGSARTTVRTRQIHHGIPVDGAELLLTLEGDRVVRVRGTTVGAVPPVPKVSEAAAVRTALAHAGMTEAANHPEVTITSELVIRVLPKDAFLAWKVRIDAMRTQPVVFVDAVSGEVVFALDEVRHVVGSGTLQATDTASAITASFGVEPYTEGRGANRRTTYRLLSSEADGDVWTLAAYFCYGGLLICGDDVFSPTDDTDFSAVDARFTTAHKHAEATLQFLSTHGLSSYDGAGGALKVYQFRGDDQWDNAGYGGGDYILVGDGSYDAATGTGLFTPFNDMGTIAHEIGHAVDAKLGANLTYAGESGALSEHWADVQAFAARSWFENTTANAHTLGADFTPGSWMNEEACGRTDDAPSSNTDCGLCTANPVCGDGACNDNEVCVGAAAGTECAVDCGTCSGAVATGDGSCDRGQDIAGDYHHAYIRNMAEPGQVHQPDTYGGDYWFDPTGCLPSNANDNCGVHTNSGVGNRAIYVLMIGDGVVGPIDGGDAGRDAVQEAYAVALRTLRFHTTTNDGYQQWADGMVIAAEEIYGAGSAEAWAVDDAWNTVGIDPADPSAAPVCGDATCDATEDCGSCEADCGVCATCGDGVCDLGEDLTCAADCGCALAGGGETCVADGDCCSGRCKGKPGARTCRE